MLTGDQLRQSFLAFFQAQSHALIPSASLVPQNDPTVLFTTAGMHSLVPYLLGEPHPLGRRLTNVQKCLRTDDIDEVGDRTHGTFFEMLGFWSLGDYWQSDSLRWTLEWFTDGLGLDRERIHVTVFAGDANVPRDDEAAAIWRGLGIPDERIVYLGKHDNWWGPVGQTGPCGPDSELFYDTGRPAHGTGCQAGCNCGKYVEIGNNVFMQYNNTSEGTFVPLAQRNVDVGLGLDRLLAILNGTTVYETDLYAATMAQIDTLRVGTPEDRGERMERLRRIVADHLRAATFLIADGVLPSNTERGYICRRLIRRAVRAGHELGITVTFTASVAATVIETYVAPYPELVERRGTILDALNQEEDRFRHTLERGLREFERIATNLRQDGHTEVSGKQIFHLFDTFGFPPELTVELVHEHGLTADMDGFTARFKEHQVQSRAANDGRFAGGLAGHTDRTTQLHTATHLLQQALRDVLGDHVHQMGSNITTKRLRFDFSHPTKLTAEEIAQVEAIVNTQIARNLPTTMAMMPLNEALAAGALAFFGERYPDTVNVYRIGDYSLEVCGGPHVTQTGGMGHFRILKTQTIGQGVQRIRADLIAEAQSQ